MAFSVEPHLAFSTGPAVAILPGPEQQEVFPRDHERLNAPFRPVIAELNAAVMQIGRQRGPLVLEVVQSNAQLRLRRSAPRF